MNAVQKLMYYLVGLAMIVNSQALAQSSAVSTPPVSAVQVVAPATKPAKDPIDLITATAASAVDTVKWVFVAFATLFTALGAVLAFFGHKSLAAVDRNTAEMRKEVDETRREVQKTLTESADKATSALRDHDLKLHDALAGIEKAKMAVDAELAALSARRKAMDQELEEIREKLQKMQRLSLDAVDSAVQVSMLSDFSFRELRDRFEEHQQSACSSTGASFDDVKEMLKRQVARGAMLFVEATEANARELGNDRIVSWAVAMRAVIHLYENDFDNAIQWALKSRGPENNPQRYADRHFNLAQVYAKRYGFYGKPEDRVAAVAALADTFEVDASFVGVASNDPDLLWYLAKGSRDVLKATITMASSRSASDAG